MTHPNFQTNGASLEDCHTNFFALTDLCGIKWRRLQADSVFCLDPLDDPVLLSFTKCIAADILCVWRRVPSPLRGLAGGDAASSGTAQLGTYKELWIFWYGEEPDFASILCPELSEIEQGSWESGLSYECRTLLFKALHNLIERCLLSRDFVRLDRWFLEPLDAQDKPGKGLNLTFSLNFFVHGDSTVCASVDVRQHIDLQRLAKHHLVSAQGSSSGISVVLSPYGLHGTLTGHAYKDNDLETQRLLEEWRKFYPIDARLGTLGQQHSGGQSGDGDGAGGVASSGSSGNYQMPALVEVLVGGVCMRYPSCYVLVSEFSSSQNPSLPAPSGGTTFLAGLPATGHSSGFGLPLTAASDGFNPAGNMPAFNSLVGQCAGAMAEGGSFGGSASQPGPNSMLSISLTPPSSPGETTTLTFPTSAKVTQAGTGSVRLTNRNSALSNPFLKTSKRIASRAWQDGVLSSGAVTSLSKVVEKGGHPSGGVGDAAEEGGVTGATNLWDMADPAQKLICACSKCKRKRQQSSSNSINSQGAGSQAPGGPANSNFNPGQPGSNSGSSMKRPDKPQIQRLRNLGSFHRRSPMTDCEAGFEQEARGGLTGGTGLPGGLVGTGAGSNPTYHFKGGTSVGQSTAFNISGRSGAMGFLDTASCISSPPSAAPSPLMASHSQPSSVNQADPTMPTLSPHPPPLKDMDGPLTTVAGSSATTVVSSNGQHDSVLPSVKLESQMDSQAGRAVFPGGGPAENGVKVESAFPPSHDLIKTSENTWQPPQQHCLAGVTSTTHNTSTIASVRGKITASRLGVLKRPLLPARSYQDDFCNDDEPVSEILYDYSTMISWAQQPPKKFKPQPKLVHPRPPNPMIKPLELYLQTTSPAGSGAKREPLTPLFSNHENGDFGFEGGGAYMYANGGMNGGVALGPGGVPICRGGKQEADPYEFVDDGPSTSMSLSGFKSKSDTPKDDETRSKGTPGGCGNGDAFDFPMSNGARSVNGDGGGISSSPATPSAPLSNSGNLYTEKGLEPTYEDLDRLFESSDDDSNNDGGSAPASVPKTPQGAGQAGEDAPPTTQSTNNNPVKCKSSTLGSMFPIAATELSRMFPTPPSLEHNPAASPCGNIGGMTDLTAAVELIDSKEQLDIYPNYGSPTNEKIRDWSYVYKPKSVTKLWGSSKYAPLTNLPSHVQTPVVVPPHCTYSPSWQYMCPIGDKHSTQSHTMPVMDPYLDRTQQPPLSNVGGGASLAANAGGVRFPTSLLSPAASFFNGESSAAVPTSATNHGAIGNHHTNEHRMMASGATVWDMMSPASNASSYLNRGLASMDNSANVSQVPEAHSLLVNLVISDSMLNIFRDHNFDSCTMCVCHMTIKGSDSWLYLSESAFSTDEPDYKCNCGFSAVVNRKYAYKAGLFYEDEVEITGVRDEPREKRQLSTVVTQEYSKDNTGSSLELGKPQRDLFDGFPHEMTDILKTQVTTVFYASTNRSPFPSPSSATVRHSQLCLTGTLSTQMSHRTELEHYDGCSVVFAALDQGRQATDSNIVGKMDEALKGGCLSRWPVVQTTSPISSDDSIRLLRSLQPLLQDAVQKKCTTKLWEATYTVSGPLTWRQFHRLSGRGTEDQCEPQPIPSLLVGHDSDWMALSPFAVKYWDKLFLEPYSLSRDVAYIVVSPDNEFILSSVRAFFKELTTAYELCRLGRHSPITKVLRDGIMRIGKAAAKKLVDEPVDDWFGVIQDTQLGSKLRLYAQVCRHHLAPHLATQAMDRTLLEPLSNTKMAHPASMDKPHASPRPPSTPESQERAETPKPPSEMGGEGAGGGVDVKDQGYTSTSTIDESEENREPPALVIYIVDPFSYAVDNPDLRRLATLGLIRCYSGMLRFLPEAMQSNINLQLIPLENILELTKVADSNKNFDSFKALSFSIFSHCRRTLVHQSTAKSLTGFGPAAAADAFLRIKSQGHERKRPFQLYSPPYILAPLKDKQTELGESFGDRREKSTALYCMYCLSEDQKWLIAACTDDRGEILDTEIINIHIPNRSQRKKASARKIGLQKLMDWVLGVMSTSVQPWRLVVGRLGRLGHGELKGWSSLLSRKNLIRFSKHLSEICRQCQANPAGADSPTVLSACLVSLEPDSSLCVMSDHFTPDERFGSSCKSCALSTPQDASCTHILVFPTSATTQSSQATFQQDHMDALGPALGDDDILSALHDDLNDTMNDISDIFDWNVVQSPVNSPSRRESSSQPGSPGMGGASGRHSPFPNSEQNKGGDGVASDTQEETVGLLQQPLALGYYVSTAGTGPMPPWFWRSCPHLETACPSFLKSALHIHSTTAQQSSDDLLQQHQHRNYHPLDSNLTTDILRYVLEGYNALSWLAIDPLTHDRRSCLPVHGQILMQMSSALSTLL